MDALEEWIELLLTNAGVDAITAPYYRLIILLITLVIVAGGLFLFTKHIIIHSLYKLFKRTSFEWDDGLADLKVFDNLAHIVPAFLVEGYAGVLFQDFENLLPLVLKLTDAYIVMVGLLIVLSFLRFAEYRISQSPLFSDKPIASYFQLLRIILYIATGILMLSVLMGRSPVYFLSAFGAMTAIILLIFKDTILGFVASVQMSANDMVRVGDWIEMPKFNADGDVVAINLNTVKVKNWDKTVTSIPTYYFVTDSFKNWRGMQESGGRRIMRSLHINVQSIKFVSPEDRERYKKYYLLTDYIIQRQQEIERFNADHNIDTSELINGRRMTNIGVYRHYILAYLKNHNRIRLDMTLLVRQLPIQDRGIPIEIYCFTKTTAWTEYENIQADIFDHLVAASAFFDLELFQQPSGSDILKAAHRLEYAITTS